MSLAPYEPIPPQTLAHVDRLIGSRVGEYLVLERMDEARRSTLYRGCQASTRQPVTIQVLRSGLVANDEAGRASSAVNNPRIARVLGYSQLPDGRSCRVLEPLEGETLEGLLHRRGALPAPEVVRVLGELVTALEAVHAWALVHGHLDVSSVFLVGQSVKLLDFGVATPNARPTSDLLALGRLGYAMLLGRSLDAEAVVAAAAATPGALGGLLRDLIDERLKTAGEVRKELAGVSASVDTETKPRRGRALVFGALGLALAAAGFALWPSHVEAPPEVPAPEEYDEAQPDEAQVDEPQADEAPELETSGPRPAHPRVRTVRAVPTVKALAERLARIQARLDRQARPGADLQQALFVLDKQRLRLTGAPTVEDRKEVARQLDGVARDYLRH